MSLPLFSLGQPPGVWTGRGCMATGCIIQHNYPELQPLPGLIQAAPGSIKTKDSFITTFSQTQMLSCVSMKTLKSCMPTAVGPAHYKSLFAPHSLRLLQKEPIKSAKSHPSFTMVKSYWNVQR